MARLGTNNSVFDLFHNDVDRRSHPRFNVLICIGKLIPSRAPQVFHGSVGGFRDGGDFGKYCRCEGSDCYIEDDDVLEIMDPEIYRQLSRLVPGICGLSREKR